MSSIDSPFSKGTFLAAIEAEMEHVRSRWEGVLKDRERSRSSYLALPLAMWGAFPSVSATDLQRLALAGRLVASSIFSLDQVLDGVGNTPEFSLHILAMQAEAHRRLAELFPPSARFWDRFHGHLAGYARACLTERGFLRAPWDGITEAQILDVVVGKNGVARAAIDGLAELAGDEHMREPLSTVVDDFNKATQMLDDLQDWKEDLQRGIPSLLLLRATRDIQIPRERPGGPVAEEVVQQVSRAIYYAGHASDILQRTVEWSSSAERIRRKLPDLGLHELALPLRRKAESLLGDIERIMAENRARAVSRPRVHVDPGPAAGPWQELAWDALRFLVRQYELGFGEAKDIVCYPARVGLTDGETYHFGDVFQRALVADALGWADDRLGGALRPILEEEARYLASKKLTQACGGWSYFPALPEIPPDADSLAQVMQAFLRAGWSRASIADLVEKPLSILFEDNSHSDGSFETWIVPAKGRTPIEERHAALVPTVWGKGPHADVIPNLLHALHLHDADRFHGTIDRGIAWLERSQRPDGTFPARWYVGPHYGIHVNVRLFAGLGRAPGTSRRALDFLRGSQRLDGSWAVGDREGDALSTALALLALGTGTDAPEEDAPRAAAGLAALRRTKNEDGSWPARGLIDAGVHDHGSRTLTTLFVLQAALLWHDRSRAIAQGPQPPGDPHVE